MSIVIGIPAKITDNADDLDLLLTSMRLYAPEALARTKVFYTGTSPLMYGVTCSLRQRENPDGHFGDGCSDIIKHTTDDIIFFLNTDTVFTPHTWQLLQQDIADLEAEQVQWGLLGLRSNFSAGYQNIRRRFPNDPEELQGLVWESENYICEVAQVFGVAFVVKRSVLNAVSDDWTKLHWFGDNLLSYDLKQREYRHFISRAYVHHHGSRSGLDYQTYDREAKEWLKKNRPDFFKTIA